MTPHFSTVVDSERIVYHVGRVCGSECFRVKLDCGHQDEIPAGMRRRCPTVVRCTQCELNQSAGRTEKQEEA